jgi:RNA 2',3'-cyclic 3'-phosphodiesterase
MKNTLRTFLAVELEPSIRARAGELISALQTAETDVKWVEPDNLHLTLKFLDEVPVAEIPAVCRAVAEGAARIEPFELEILGAGAFPNAGRPRTIWLGARDGADRMGDLHRQIEKTLAALGFRKEHRLFKPHLTIGRVRHGGGRALSSLGDLLWRHAEFPAGRQNVGEVVVFSSDLRREGPVYEALGRAPLGNRE